jgi:hypothetical protein
MTTVRGPDRVQHDDKHVGIRQQAKAGTYLRPQANTLFGRAWHDQAIALNENRFHERSPKHPLSRNG